MLNSAARPIPTTTPEFAELSVVRLTTDVEADGKLLKAGAVGTIVFVYCDAKAYEVEFFDQDAAVVTLTADNLTQ